MVRKRKIPVRKHHGIRDPIKQKEKVERSLKNVINNPPAQDDQKPSAKFSRFKKLMDATKAGKKVKIQTGREDKPRKSGNKKHETANKPRAIKQFVDEADEDYLRRVNRITRESVQDAQYEIKYGVNVIRDTKSGAITIQKRPKNEIDELLKQKAKEKRAGSGKGNRKKVKAPAKRIDPKLAKELIRQAIKEDDEERNRENAKELQEYQKDDIKFGEIVHAPPTLSTIPRRAEKSETVPRPGRKNNLLLKSMFNDTAATSTKTTTQSQKVIKPKASQNNITKAQLKGKRKDLPTATRTMLENERLKMVEIYRQYKKTKESATK